MKQAVPAKPIRNPFLRCMVLGSASGLGLGYAPFAPGTFGSLLGIPLGLWLLQFPTWIGLVFAVVFLIPACLISERAGDHWGNKDSGRIVIDEVLGQAIAILGIKPLIVQIISPTLAQRAPREFFESATFANYLDLLNLVSINKTLILALIAAFALFRAFDITKPFPARTFDRQGNGFGVMMDDVVAGLYAAIVVRALIKIFT